MSDELDQNELKNALQGISKQLERIAELLETLAEIAQADRKKERAPFPTSQMRETT